MSGPVPGQEPEVLDQIVVQRVKMPGKPQPVILVQYDNTKDLIRHTGMLHDAVGIMLRTAGGAVRQHLEDGEPLVEGEQKRIQVAKGLRDGSGKVIDLRSRES